MESEKLENVSKKVEMFDWRANLFGSIAKSFEKAKTDPEVARSLAYITDTLDMAAELAMSEGVVFKGQENSVAGPSVLVEEGILSEGEVALQAENERKLNTPLAQFIRWSADKNLITEKDRRTLLSWISE